MGGLGAVCAQGLWVAGFDLFYSLFDLDHDRAAGLQLVGHPLGRARRLCGCASVPPARRGAAGSRRRRVVARVFYWLGLLAVAGLLLYEHTIVRPGDTRRLDAAFFTVNGVISIVFFAFVLIDTLS